MGIELNEIKKQLEAGVRAAADCYGKTQALSCQLIDDKQTFRGYGYRIFTKYDDLSEKDDLATQAFCEKLGIEPSQEMQFAFKNPCTQVWQYAKLDDTSKEVINQLDILLTRYGTKNAKGETYRPEKFDAVYNAKVTILESGSSSPAAAESLDKMEKIVNKKCFSPSPSSFRLPAGSVGLKNLEAKGQKFLYGIISRAREVLGGIVNSPDRRNLSH